MSLNERSEESTKDLAEANKAQITYWKENTAKKMSDENEIMYDAETLGKVINLFIYSFIHLFIYSFIHLFIYLSQKPTPPTVLNVENSKLACRMVIRFRSW